jgi:hypothetical protein
MIKRTLVLIFLLILLYMPLAVQDKVELDESQIKSGFLYKICRFTRWSRKNATNSPIIISIIGETTPANELDIPEDKRIHERRIVIRKIKELPEIDNSHVLFITASESGRLDTILGYIADKDVLTVGDTKGFAQRGVIINFYREKSNVRFEINRDAVKKSPVKLSTQLFTVARVVETEKNE